MKKYFIFLIFFLIIVLGFFLFGIYLPKDKKIIEEKIFVVEKGQNLLQIAANLENQNLIKSRWFFNFYVVLKNSQNKLQTGEYYLSPSMNVAEVSNKIISGGVIKEGITIVEGWNLRDIGFYLEGKGMFQAEELWELAGFPAVNYLKAEDLPVPKDFSNEFDFLKDKPKYIGLEGYLFPDTYYIKKQETLENIIRKMLSNFDKKLNSDLRKEIKKQAKTIFEVITMASLLEKEVKSFEERKLVAGILWKRLKGNVPLQVDATISYITGKKTTKISKEETQIDSPFNTYKYKGLPLGPICNPSLDSIIASLYPENSEYWYYLSAPDGKTIFSKTLEEHNIAKTKY